MHHTYTLVDNRISAVPVVNDKDQVLGVISEYDLMTRLVRRCRLTVFV